jgi:hypothetical protein
VDQLLLILALPADGMRRQNRQAADRTDHLRALGVLHAAIGPKHDVLASHDFHPAVSTAWQLDGHYVLADLRSNSHAAKHRM